MKRISLIIIFVLVFSQLQNAQSNKLRFEKITTDDGLSNNNILHIFQDKRGFLWISTNDGINRYDGYTFKHYRHISGSANSLGDYAANHIFEDTSGIFWISTREGLNVFNPLSEKFTHYKSIPNDSTSISTDKIVCTNKDKNGNIWIATRNGLNLFNPKTKKFTVFKNNPDDKHSLSFNYVTSIFNDSKGSLWIGTQRGLNKFNYKNKSFDVYYFDPQNDKSISSNLITCFFEDSNRNLWVGTISGLNKLASMKQNNPEFVRYKNIPGNKNTLSSNNIRVIDEDARGRLWIATLGGGLNIFYPSSNRFESYIHNVDDKSSISDNIIMSLFIDNYDNVWIGTHDKGISKYSITKERFELFQPHSSANKEITGNSITSILIDDKNNLWLGTDGDGIKVYKKDSIFNEDNFLFELKEDQKKLNTISSDNVTSIIQNKDGLIFIGTFGGGLNIYDPQSEKTEVFKYNRDDPNSLGNDFIHTLFEDSKGNIWIGTGLAGLNRFDKKNRSFKRFKNNNKYPNNPKYLNSPEVSAICEDDQGFLWAGTTTGGLSRFDTESEKFLHFKHLPEDKNSISSNRIVALFFDSNNRLWAGTFGGGLNFYDKNNKSFSHFLERDGLPSNTVQAIIEDDEKNIWIATTKGISKFYSDKKLFRSFDESDGLQGGEFNQGAVFKDKNKGTLYFGGDNGLNIYSPKSFIERKNLPDIAFTDFKLFNKSVLNKLPILKNADEKEIVLAYDENIFSFEFAALDFTSPLKNRYAYKLEGFDKDWIYSGGKREVTYTNLDPGSYIFKVKGSNSDGIWNEKGMAVDLIIEPPFWKTWWAYLVYLFVIVTGFLSIRKYELNRIKLRNDLKLKEFESEKLMEVDRIKSSFVANLSHEFRTPLTIILGSLEKLKGEMRDNPNEKDFDVMKRNASRLLQLINQLLELSRIESGSVKLNASENDIVKFLKRITASFSSLADQKNIELRFNCVPIDNINVNKEIHLFYDKKKLETVFYNLLSNAVKYTPVGEKIDVNILKDEKFAEIKFLNTGVEIPKENISKIFDRFYQVDESGTRNFEGTGIGLALAKEYLELHKGRIEVESENGKTIFTVYLRLGRSHLMEEEINFDKVEEIIEGEYLSHSIPAFSEMKEDIREKDKTIILVVEDNFDLREMIKEILHGEYRVVEAENGIEGLKLAEKLIPDLIISDIMMPQMDGYEFSGKIKASEKTNHIPLIILTAKAAAEDKLQGLETGADDYLIKPFDEKELKIRIKNLIKIRRQMREKFQSQMLIKPGEVVVASSQKIFVDKLTAIIEENISVENFSVEILCEKIGMSRTQLHRKIKAVTNQSTTEFIRNFRLQRAAELLKKDAGNIAQISYEVGFSSQAYFTKMFQQVYRQTPLEYKKQHAE